MFLIDGKNFKIGINPKAVDYIILDALTLTVYMRNGQKIPISVPKHLLQSTFDSIVSKCISNE